jgi:hypothetical protein
MILWVAVHMAHKAGGFKVIHAGMVSEAENSTGDEGLAAWVGRPSGVLAPQLPAGKLAKRPILPIIWTVCRQSIHFFSPRFEQEARLFPRKMAYCLMFSIA